jgi:hypothetical protein
MKIPQAEATRMLALIDGKPPTSAVRVESMQSLWSGMGGVFLLDDRVVLKTAKYPGKNEGHGTRNPLSPARDVESYRCEAAFYERQAPRLLAPPISIELPKPLLVESDSLGFALCMSRLDGQPARGSLDGAEARAALEWLAKFHAAFWGLKRGELGGLQQQGTYWYLDTRPDELKQVGKTGWAGRLRSAARALDERCKADALLTCVHGDAKSANIFFRKDSAGKEVAQFFDFQYVGLAPPTKDLCYLLSTATNAEPGSAEEDGFLRHYLTVLAAGLTERGITPPGMRALRQSLDVASADLARFLCGWGWWARPSLKTRVIALLDELDGGELLSEAEYVTRLFEKRPPDYGGDVGA